MKTSFENLEDWVKERAYFNIEGLTKSICEDLSSYDKLWAAMEQLQLVITDRLSYETRIKNIDKLVTALDNEVMSAPSAQNPTDKDTYQERQFLFHEKQTKQEEAKDAFTAWESKYKRLRARYDEHVNSDGTPRTKTEPDTTR